MSAACESPQMCDGSRHFMQSISRDFEDQATDLENQEALEAIENSKIHEIRQIQAALKRVSKGAYGICAHCGEDIDPKHLEALPIGNRFISCAERRIIAGLTCKYYVYIMLSGTHNCP